MNSVEKSIIFTSDEEHWMNLRVQHGNFTDDSAYIKDLIKKDQLENNKLVELQNAIEEGLQSGKSPLKVKDIIEKVNNGEL